MLAIKNRFHRRNHVQKVYQSGIPVRGKQISLKYRISQSQPEYRVAVVVTKKVAKSAVSRNRIRRRVFEAIRLQAQAIPEGFEGVFGVYDSQVSEMSSELLATQIKQLLSKLK